MLCTICSNNLELFCNKNGGYEYFFCHSCHTLILYPPPSKKQLLTYYQTDFNYSVGLINKEKSIIRARNILKRFKKLNPFGQRILDIGFGYGFLLSEAERMGFETYGLEPSLKLYTNSLKRLSELNLFNLDLESFLKTNQKKFDLIVLNHVIEHIVNPMETIRRLKTRLNKNGLIFIETPNLGSHLFFTEQENYTFLTPPEHIFLFSLQSLKYIVKNIDLTIVYSNTYSYPEHFMGILKKNFLNRNKTINPINKVCSNNEKKETKLGIKYYLFDRLTARLLTPILNWGGYGSILELFIGINHERCSA